MRNLLVVILLIICSCYGCYVDRFVPIEQVNTEYITKIQKDSIRVYDSIDRYISGDTVYLYKYKYIFQEKIKTDTFIQKDTISIPVEVKVTKEVNKILWYQEVLMWLGVILLLLASYKIGRFIKR